MGMTPGYNHRLRLHNTLPSVLSRRQLQLPAPHLLSAGNIVALQQGPGCLRNPFGGRYVMVFLALFCFLPIYRGENKTKTTESFPSLHPPTLCPRAAPVLRVGEPALPLAAVRGRS